MDDKPTLFIGSSTETLSVAYAIQENLEYDTEPTVWTQGIFALSKSTLGSLLKALDSSDFAVFVFAPDDLAFLRKTEAHIPRDNVVFELGLFMGRLGPDRVYFITPRGDEKLHLPTDLLGITPGNYDPGRSDGNLVAALGPTCNKIRTAILSASPKPMPRQKDQMILREPTEKEQIALLSSWLDNEIASVITRATQHAEIEDLLHLPMGSSHKYIASAVAIAKRRFKIVVNTPSILQLRAEG